MLLLHVSDIHFREPDCTNPDLDPDRPYRSRLLQDVRERVGQAGGTVGALLIGGDVAFKGHPTEYQVAKDWIYELAQASGCHFERIFVVPGNHDVNRAAIAASMAVRNSQEQIARAAPEHRESQFREQLADADTGRALFRPLEAYNEFAKFFNCQVYAPDRLYWKQDIPLGGGVHLRVHGLTSVLLSGAGGRDDTREGLDVGSCGGSPTKPRPSSIDASRRKRPRAEALGWKTHPLRRRCGGARDRRAPVGPKRQSIRGLQSSHSKRLAGSCVGTEGSVPFARRSPRTQRSCSSAQAWPHASPPLIGAAGDGAFVLRRGRHGCH